MTYRLDAVGLPFMALAAVTMLGEFGGTEFERGVAGLLVLASAEIASLEFKSDNPNLGFKLLVWVGVPLGVALYVAGLVLTLGGLS